MEYLNMLTLPIDHESFVCPLMLLSEILSLVHVQAQLVGQPLLGVALVDQAV